jgi:hypothetical protein
MQVFLRRVPWGKFLLLWALALLMGSALLWLHFGFTPKFPGPFAVLAAVSALGILWGTTRPRWEKAHCAWCMERLQAHSKKYDEGRKGWVTYYPCPKCGHVTEKFKADGSAGQS